MAKCEICGKRQISGNKISHSNIKNKRKWNINLQTMKIKNNGENKKIKICTRCLRSEKTNIKK